MKASLLLGALAALGSSGWAGEIDLPADTRIRLNTGEPPWSERGRAREIRGHVLHEDDDALTFQRPEGGEPVTRTKRGHWMRAWLVDSDDEWVRVRPFGRKEPVRIPRNAIVGFEVSKGGSRGRGALIGAAIGAVTFAAIGYADGGCASARPGGRLGSEWPDLDGLCLFDRGATTAMGAIGGGVLGSVFGLAFGGERWRPHPLAKARVGIAPVRGGATVRLVLRF